VCEELDLEPGQTLIDLACSFNIFQLFLAWSGLDVTGVDIDAGAFRDLEPRLEHVRTAATRPVAYTFRQANALELPFVDAAFDRAISISSLEHMFTPSGAPGPSGDTLGLREAARVVRPGGRLVVTVPMSGGGPFHEAPDGDAGFPEPYRLYTPEALADRFHAVEGLRLRAEAFVPHRVPVPGIDDGAFMQYWLATSPEERARLEPFAPVLAAQFQPLVRVPDDPAGFASAHTALLAFDVL
jgi:SAM-dependent methyltransferase